MDELTARLVAVHAALGDPYRLSGGSDGVVGISRKDVDRLDELPADGPAFAALELLARRTGLLTLIFERLAYVLAADGTPDERELRRVMALVASGLPSNDP